MNRLIRLLAAITAICLSVASMPTMAADMAFQFINDTDRSLSLKLFSRDGAHQQWPSKTRAYSVKPDAAVQQLKISCEEGEQICWGAWMTVQEVSGEIGASGQRNTRTVKHSAGVGERGVRVCANCCHVCKEGALTPVAKLNDPDHAAK